MAERSSSLDHVISVSSRPACCRCGRAAANDHQLVPVPLCSSRHYVCRSCLASGLSCCPGCLTSVPPPPPPPPVMDGRRVTGSPWTRRVNGSTPTDANGNGTVTGEQCAVCGRRTDQWLSCQSCADTSPCLCQSCWQQHQLDVHVFPRLQSTTSSPELYPLISSPRLPTPVDEQTQRLAASVASASNSSSVLRQIRPRVMTAARDDQSISSLLGGLMLSTATVEASTTSSPGSAVSGLLAVGLQEPSVRRARLVALQAPLARQYEGWLWQALNNGGFEQAVRNIDDRRQQIGVNLQSTLGDMELRLERARGVLDELYRDCMRQVIEVSRCQMEALQVQAESLQRVRAAAARLQHARLYGDQTRALVAETELAAALRHNAASTCLRPCDDGALEFRSPSDDDLRVYLRSVCSVDSRVHPAHCSVQSVDRDVNCLSWTMVGRPSEFDVQLRNHCHVGVVDAGLTVLISDHDGVELTYDYQRRSAGRYVVRYRPLTTGTHHIYVLLRDRHLADSPYTVRILSTAFDHLYIRK